MKKDFDIFLDLYQQASDCTDSKKANDLFINCIVQSNKLIETYDKFNYLQLFRHENEIMDTYYKNAELLVRTIGLNSNKTTLTKNENDTLNTVIQRLRKCLTIKPMDGKSFELFRIVFVYLSTFVEKIEDKILYLKQVIMLNPIDYELHLNLGMYFMIINKLDDSLQHYRHCWGILNLLPITDELKNIKIKCLNNIGNIYSTIQDRNLAEYYFKMALEISPDDPDINNHLGALHTELRNTEIAIKYYKHGIENYKKSYLSNDENLLLASMYMNMGMAYCYECKFIEAINCYNTALKFKPNLSLAYQNKLLDLNYISYMIEDPMYVSKCHKALNSIYPNVITKYQENYIIKKEIVKLDNILSFKEMKKKLIKSKTKLNIGFVSGDFLNHPVSYFINVILRYLDLDIFSIFCFSGKPIGLPSSDDILGHCDWSITKNLSNVQLKQLIQSKNIDILFDLSAHTGDNRLDTFVLKPAPIQISYCGYPGTSGVKSIDYHLTDTFCDSPDTQKYYTEKLIFLKNCFLSYTPLNGLSNLPALTIEQPCIKNEYITFGSFNRLNKINKNVIIVWKSILEKIPTARLIIKTKEFGTEKLKKQFMSDFKDYLDRITILEYSDTSDEHFSDYNNVDILLDTFPYSGTTTSCESLLMGVPVITLFDNIKHYHVQNVTTSLLKNSDLEDFVTYSEEEYIQKCIDYSEIIESLDTLKRDVRGKFINGHVCNYPEFIENFQDILLKTYKNHSW
jgi:protein O-GlcNAc transferase